MRVHQAAQPAVFQLLLAPDLRQAVGLGADLGLQRADRGVHVEQRAVGVEDAGLRAADLWNV
jgi:hypothetical protein